MKKIFKYQVGNGVSTPMHANAEIMHIDMQNEEMYIWALVDVEDNPVDCMFFVFGTGMQLPDNIDDMLFIGTVMDGMFVWHVFMQQTT